jgi:hypothetical protein
MKKIVVILLLVAMFSSTAFSQIVSRQITNYNPSPNALHPFKLASLVIRPPIGLLSIFVKGGYWVLDSEPIRRGFNIDYDTSMTIDEDY